MIRYSHVSLVVPCNAESAEDITSILGIQPTRVREETAQIKHDNGWRDCTAYTWMLDSPLCHTDGEPTERLKALADTIEPVAARLPLLRPRFQPWIDIVYHTTPQHPHGVTGEFDWFRLSAELMRRYGGWELNISYEVFWFDHPNWHRPTPGGWFHRLLNRWRVRT